MPIDDFRPWVDSHKVVQRGGQIFRFDGVFIRVRAVRIRGTIYESALHSAASQQHGVTLFTHPNDQRLVKQATLFEIVQQRWQRLIGQGKMILVDNLVHP